MEEALSEYLGKQHNWEGCYIVPGGVTGQVGAFSATCIVFEGGTLVELGRAGYFAVPCDADFLLYKVQEWPVVRDKWSL